MQETATVTSDTALPEQKKTQNDHQDISQSPVKALFQTSKDQATPEKGSNKEVRSTATKAPTDEEVPVQESMTLVEHRSEGVTHSEKLQDLWATNPPTKVSMDGAATWQNSTNFGGSNHNDQTLQKRWGHKFGHRDVDAEECQVAPTGPHKLYCPAVQHQVLHRWTHSSQGKG